MENRQPLLSVVIVGRNDNYGGDFRDRLQNCINALHAELIRSGIEAEILFVNYNPLPEPDIHRFISWPLLNPHIQVSAVTVPEPIHQEILAKGKLDQFPMLEFVAKNIGIRRASGQYILSMNADIILPEGFLSHAASLRPDTFYRADRYDFTHSSNDPKSIEGSVTAVHLKGRAFQFSPRRVSGAFRQWILLRWRMGHLLYRLRTALIPERFPVHVKHFDRRAEMRYHCHASGDFMLMHRAHWMSIRGYNEQSRTALHVDSLAVIQAATLGLRECVLPMPIYHCDHARRFDAAHWPEEYVRYQQLAQTMLHTRKLTIFNEDDWGAANSTLPIEPIHCQA